MTTDKPDTYQLITDKIIAELEQGVVPWQRPWDPEKCAGPAAPVNAVTRVPYHGVNTLILGMHEAAFLTGDPRFCTYKQAAEKGWQVRKGEHGTPIVFYKPIEVEADEKKGEGPASRLVGMLRTFSVFHASQIDGMPAYVPPTAETCPWLRPEAASVILEKSRAAITVGGDMAFYSPRTDHINLPPDHAFRGPPQWAATALHELGHWTGHSSRLNRDLSGKRGTAAYAREELRAELASAFIGGALNLPSQIDSHASYVDHYLTVLKGDKRELFRAAADAQRITDHVLAFHPDYAATPKPEASSRPAPPAKVQKLAP